MPAARQRERLWIYTVLPALILNISAILVFGTYYGLQYAQPDAVAGIGPGQAQFAASVVIFVVEWAFALSIVIRLKRAGSSAMALVSPAGRPWRFRWGPALVVFAAVNGIFAIYLFLANLLYGDLAAGYAGMSLGQRIAFVLLVPVTAAFCEELIWRGYIMTRLEARGYRPWTNVLLSAVSFSLIHGIFMPDKLLVTFLVGLICGWYYLRERNLVPLMIAHWVLDFWSFGLFLLVL